LAFIPGRCCPENLLSLKRHLGENVGAGYAAWALSSDKRMAMRIFQAGEG
jgi:hypothetical protein